MKESKEIGKKKQREYLPLYWCKKLKREMTDFIDEDITPEQLYCLLDSIEENIDGNEDTAIAIMADFCRNHEKFRHTMKSLLSLKNSHKVLEETLKDFDSMASILFWERDKQVFRFDKDFADELIRTENIIMAKDTFRYLPYTTFYVDISENREICNAIAGEGFFVTVRLKNNYWHIHLCKVTEKFYFGDTILVRNENGVCDLAEGMDAVDTYNINLTSKEVEVITERQKVDYAIYQTLVFQVLTYLASSEPDLAESAETKATYQKTEVPKNKFSEIRKWDVGVRFGAACRSWKAMQENGGTHGTSGKGGYHVRPHSRRAHWQHFWYGKKGEERVRRPKWVQGCLVNMCAGENSPAVIHRCG